MEYRLELAAQAVAQAEEIREWLATRSPSSADRWIRRLHEGIESLRKFPARCPVSDTIDKQIPKTRELLVGKRPAIYRVRFLIIEDRVRVLSINHASQNSTGP